MQEKIINLSQLLGEIAPQQALSSIPISGLCLDSRQAKEGDLFLAFTGVQHDGRQFMKMAAACGVAAIVAEATNFDAAWLAGIHNIPCVLVPNLQAHLGEIAARFYDHPSRKLHMIGVTGTNGKTSVTHYIAEVLNLLQPQNCAVIGTVGYGIPPDLKDHGYTTPDALNLQKILAEFAAVKVKTVAMEVSSHALAQSRVGSIDYTMAIFTNLTRDHLDYHQTMANYGAAKQKLFTDFNVQHAIINIDDSFGQLLMTRLKETTQAISYAVNNLDAAVTATAVNFDRTGITALLHTPWGQAELSCRLLGRFNLHNILAVIAALGVMGIPLTTIVALIKQIHGVRGRMQTFSFPQQPLVVVDYAHTPDALAKALGTLRELTPGKLWCVFGCGGDRDPGKRPLMGKIAEQFADEIIITDDNPRHEQPAAIVADILQGMLASSKTRVVEHDRRLAIQYAMQHAALDDVILIAGKGHEAYQQIGDVKISFDDSQVVQDYCKQRNID